MGIDLTLHIVELDRLLNNRPDASRGETRAYSVQSLRVPRFPELTNKIHRLGGGLVDGLPVKVLTGTGILDSTSKQKDFKSKMLMPAAILSACQEYLKDKDWMVRAFLAYLKEVPDGAYLVVTD